jgi:hypothetical protein
MGRGRKRKIDGKPYDVQLTVSREELQAILDLVSKRFRETGIEYTKQDLVREAVRLLCIREGVLQSSKAPVDEGIPLPKNKR